MHRLLVTMTLLLTACGGEAEWGADGSRGRSKPRAPQVAAVQPRKYACGASIAPDQAAADAEVRASYRRWREDWTTRRGAHGLLRVRAGPQLDDATVSEGIGYGMLLAAYLDDRPTFDQLWAYAQRYRNARGLMAWLIDADGSKPDGSGTAATDGDEDMAFALLVAHGRWGGYRADAARLISALLEHTVEPGTYVPKPGDTWGGSEVTNPSYFAPAYYKAFAAFTGDSTWIRVADSSYRILHQVAAKSGAGTGLQPDWTTAAGDTVRIEAGRDYEYGYDATRVPWRLAMDATWNCDQRALWHLQRMNTFFRRVGVENLRDGYTIEGRPTGRWHTGSFVAPAAAAALTASDPAYRLSAWRETVKLRATGYYHDSLRLLSLLLASGNMPPVDVQAQGR